MFRSTCGPESSALAPKNGPDPGLCSSPGQAGRLLAKPGPPSENLAMLIPQYSLRLILIIMTCSAVVFSIFAAAKQGSAAAAGITAAIVMLAAAVMVYVAVFAVVWLFSLALRDPRAATPLPPGPPPAAPPADGEVSDGLTLLDP
jgi:hypothetical protein